jgi:exodeoxyribonuclease V gamma subunit
MTSSNRTGLLVLHGNRLEMLADAVAAWLAANPLAPLEQETILVQSNGMAEWIKMELARAHGVCAATTVELPARFIWRAYRAVLGRGAVPAGSPLDKLPLTWRLMRLLPSLAREPSFEPVDGFLSEGDAQRRLQLSQRLADLFDQYQVYRSDWLDDWRQGADVIRAGTRSGQGGSNDVPAGQLWQPALWRALLDTLTVPERTTSRAVLHQRFIDALQKPAPTAARRFPDLPRRIVLFGTTHIPHQTLEAIAALAAHCQVLMAVPNPCRYHWADTIDGREMLHFERRRHVLRNDRDLAAVSLQDMHAHGHPLLAAWGRQSRDFVRQLDAFDDAQSAQRRFEVPRVDLFDESPGNTLLQQVQGAIRDLTPLAEHGHQGASDEDRSIVFHVAHGAQREVEILHDQLLRLLATPPGEQALNPRDIVVMVPDIDTFAPAIRSVFGQYQRWEARHIPWGIADQKDRRQQPMLLALDWLMRAPQERFGVSRLRDLLDIPAVALRCAISPDEMPTLVQWIEDAGVRWGLNAAHRETLGLGTCGEQNTWAFGLRRMLLGYATGELNSADGFQGIEPYAEVAGLGSGLAGALAELVQTLTEWWREASALRRPNDWAERLRGLLGNLFEATDETERALLDALDDALKSWLQACEAAEFDDPLDLAVVREAWLGAIDEPGLSKRFKAGGVTFCTLLPLRAIPFEVVCLLGMNDGDFPRRGSHSDFDLMALPGLARPGDRSRRDDDRQLMLDAVLSARQVLYVSWAGRSARDNQEQPPSVLVSQLRDYLALGWGADVLVKRTTQHPLQPFSRKYLEPGADGAGSELFTFAAEWRSAHASQADVTRTPATEGGAQSGGAEGREETEGARLMVQGLAAFLRNPVKEFFRHRLQVSFTEPAAADEDDESFSSHGLDRWALIDEVLAECRRQMAAQAPHQPQGQLQHLVQHQVARLKRAGRLPLAGPGRQVEVELVATAMPMLQTWQSLQAEHSQACDKLPLRLIHPLDDGLVFDDWLAGLRSAGDGGAPVWIELQASKVADAGKAKSGPRPREDKLLSAWVRCLATAACGHAVSGIVIGEAAVVRVSSPDRNSAMHTLLDLMLAWREGLRGDQPLPTAVKTGMAWLAESGAARIAFEGAYRSPVPGEGKEDSLARLFPDFDTLVDDPGFETATRRLYEPYRQWLASHTVVELLTTEVTPAEASDE